MTTHDRTWQRHLERRAFRRKNAHDPALVRRHTQSAYQHAMAIVQQEQVARMEAVARGNESVPVEIMEYTREFRLQEWCKQYGRKTIDARALFGVSTQDTQPLPPTKSDYMSLETYKTVRAAVQPLQKAAGL